jgi:hemolysin III
MKSVTHGLGIFLAMFAAMDHSIAACSAYSVSLLFLYTCSTLYHSFFALRTTHFIFGIIDKCAIYILIAGSYTPYLARSLTHKPIWSVYLLIFIWLCCFFGICVEALFQTWKHKEQLSLAIYLGMGWAYLVCIPDLIVATPKEALTLFVIGGVMYTAGVPSTYATVTLIIPFGTCSF